MGTPAPEATGRAFLLHRMDIDPQTADAGTLFNHLWATKYAAMLTAETSLESQWMAESFMDSTYTVCGEELRLMTPKDLCWLDGCESPFVVRQRIPDAADVAFFIWSLHARNTGSGVLNAFRRGRVHGRLMATGRDLAMDVAEIEEYCARVLVCLPSGGGAGGETASGQLPPKPLDVHFLAPLLVEVSAVIGPIDPASGKCLGEIPVPRLFQYRREIDRRSGKGGDNSGEVESMRSRCLEEVNAIIANRRTVAA